MSSASAGAGSGPGGRIERADVEALLAAKPDADRAVAAAAGEPGSAKGSVTTQELSRAQQLVARRSAESKATVPQFPLATEIEMQRCIELHAWLRELAGEGPVATYDDMVVRACALALREHPRANGAYRDGRFELYSRVNVGVAVAAGDSLVVPTVFDADEKSLAAVAAETRLLAEHARAGTIAPPQLSGATFTVSSLADYGVTSFAAIINPPQAATLAVGALRERFVAVDGQPAPRSFMSVTLTCDHRILYGAEAARFLGRIRGLLEHPLALLA